MSSLALRLLAAQQFAQGPNTILYMWGNNSYGQLGVSAGVTSYYSWSQLSTGASHSVAIRNDGTLWAWGNNVFGQLGDGTTINKNSPVQIGVFSWNQVSAGGMHTAAIRNDGTLWAWGNNTYNQLNDTSILNGSVPVLISSESWSQISAGGIHNSAIKLDGSLWTWGGNTSGQLGLNNVFTKVSIGISHFLGVKADGTLWAGGGNASGQLGDGTTVAKNFSNIPTVQIPGSWTNVLASSDFSMATRSSDGSLWAWGGNAWGTLGLNDTVSRSAPTQIPNTSNIVEMSSMYDAAGVAVIWRDSSYRVYGLGYNLTGGLSVGDGTPRSSPVQLGIPVGRDTFSVGVNNALSIATNGTLWAWGVNQYGGFGDNTTIDRSSPVQVNTDTWINVTSGFGTTLGIKSDYTLWGWGGNGVGTLGTNDIITISSPVQIGASSWSVVSTNGGFTLAIRYDGTLWSWGNNTTGSLGDGTVINRSSPVQIGTSSWIAIDTGYTGTAFAIRVDGALFTWGYNNKGQLGDSTTVNKSSPIQVGTSSWSQISAGQYGAVAAITTDGKLFTWGWNANGQLGSATTTDRSSPVQVGTSSWSQVSAGASHTSAIDINFRLFNWGGNQYGQLGSATTVDRSSPVQVGTSSWTTVSSKTRNSFAAKIDGTLWGWGANDVTYGLLGDNTTIAKSSPVQVSIQPQLRGLKMISAGAQVFGGLDLGNRLWTWGNGTTGGLGNNSLVNKFTAVPVMSDKTWKTISFGFGSGKGVDSLNRLWTWGENASGQLGDNTTVNKNSPVQVPGSWTNVAATPSFPSVLATDTNNTVWGWGINRYNILGLGEATTIARSSPVQIGNFGTVDWFALAPQEFSLVQANGTVYVLGGTRTAALMGVSTPTLLTTFNLPYQRMTKVNNSSFAFVSSGKQHTAAITIDDKLYTWGDNSQGKLGDSTFVTRSSPVQIAGDWNRVSAGGSHTLAIDSQYTLYSFGSNYSGQLGTNTGNSTPTWVKLHDGANHTLAIKSDSTLWVWGKNDAGQLGDGTVINRSSPVQIDGSWNSVSAGQRHTLAIKTDGSLFAWGFNVTGQLGLNYNSPRLKWKSLAIGTFAVAIAPDDTLWTWGLGTSGQLADSTAVSRSYPIQIGIENTWDQISIGLTHAIAKKKDGTVWTWGSNASGELGDNTIVPKSSPVQVPGLSNVLSVAAGGSHTAVITSDNKLFMWGNNTNGPLGDNTTNFRSSPMQLGTTGIASVYLQLYATHFLTTDNRLFAMGINTSGQLGDNTVSSRSSPVQVSGSWNSIASVNNSIYGIKTDSTLWSWGDNTSGRLAHGNTNNLQSSPVQIGTSSWSQVSAFGTTMLAKKIDNTLWVAGSNIGDGTTFGRSTPVQLTGYGAGNLSIVQPSQVADISGFADQDNNIYVWGNNNTSGVHGDGTTVAKYIPTPVSQFVNVSSPTQVTTGSWSQVAAGAYHSLAIKSDGGLYGWGLNDRGQIGTGVVGVINWTKIVGDLTQTYGIRSDGTLWGWGNNAAGQLGQSNVTNRSSPVQIGLGTYSDVASGDAHVLAVTTDGKLLGWGKNDYGQAGALSWAQIAASQDPAPFVLAIRSDGALFSWGRNNFGQLGDSTTVDRSSPVVLDTNSWSQVSAGSTHVLAKRNDGLLFAWGLNNAGQLGDFSTVARSSPIQIGNAYPSLSFNGSTEYYTVAPNTTLAFGAVDWTIEMWVFVKSYAVTSTTLYDTRPAGTGSSATYQLINISSTGILSYGSGTVVSNGALIVPLNQWNHIAVSRQGSITRLFLNGVQSGSNITDTVTYIVGTGRPIIGTDGNVPNSAGYNFNGLMSNIRVVKGVAVYTGNFTVPTSPLEATQSAGTNISAITAGQTSLLTGQGLFDRSGNNLTVAAINTAAPAPVSPFTMPDKLVGRNVLQLSAGDSISMAIGSDNTLWVWGLNASGQLGQNNTINRSSPVQVTGSWSSVTAYSSHAAAITTDNRLFTWGLNTSGQLGVNDVVTRSSPVQVDGSWINVDVGFNHTIATTSDNRLFTWGNNQSYQLGDTTTVNRSSPTQIAGSWSIVKAGASTSAAIDTTNKLYTWGNNASGQLGVAPMSWTMALNQAMVRSNGVVYIWGQNAYGEVGDGTTIQRSSPIQLGSTSWTMISKTGYVVMGIKPDYTLWAWGTNNLGSLGDGTTISRSSPVQIGIDKSWMNIFVGQNRSYAKDSTGIIWAAGSNDAGQLGDGTTIDRSSPVQINATSGSWSVISAGVSHTLALDSLGQLYGWGRNVEGQINNSPLTFAQIGNGVALRADNQLWVWGNNGGGALGDGATANRSSPVQIAGLWKSAQLRGAAATYPAGNGIRTDGTLWGWGTNTYGGIGDNSTISRSSPVQIGTDTNWLRVFGIDDANFAIKTDYTLWAWGNNNAGQLAQSDTVNRSSPVQIAGSWSLISANGGTAFGIQTDGTLWAWGVNAYGELGQNDRVYRSSPVQVGTRSWTSVSVTYNLVAAIRNDGGLFTWGHPTNGSMGDTTTIDRSSPVQLGTSSWTQVATTHGGVAAIRLDGGVFTWGSVTGVAATLRSSPVQLGTSSWTQVTSGYFTIHGVTSDNRFFTWSTQGYPQGDNTTVAKSSPVLTVATQTNLSAVLVPAYSIPTQIGNRSWSMIAAGWQHSIGVTTDNTLWGWGLNNYGQVGDTSTANRSSPVQVSIASGYSWAQISANQSATAALTTTGALWTWGINNTGQLGLNIANTVNRSSPVQVGTSSWISISTSTNNMYAIDVTNKLFTWGNGAYGALGDNQTVSRSSPALVGTNLETLIVSPVQVGNSSWSMLATTGYMMAGVTSPPAILYAWGVNTYGQLGMADAVTRSSPVQVIAGPVIPNRSSPVQIASGSWSQVTAGTSFSGAIRSDGMLFMWGINSSGQIGDGTTLNRSYPVQISTSSWIEVGSGTSHAIATKSDNSVWAWGNNQYGQLGQNDNANRSNPIQVTTSSFSQISSGANHVVGLIGNAIYGWGDNSFGQLGRSLSPVIWDTVVMGQTGYGLKNGNLYAWGSPAVAAASAGYGDGTTVAKSSPVQIGTNADKYTLLASNLGASHTVVVKSDNTIWAWGINANGQLGDGTIIARSSPVQILATAPGVSKIVLGAAYTLMLTTGGTLYGWGLNTNGQLGQGNTIARSSPVQIATNVIDVAACNLAAAYIRNDNTLWTWGSNSDGGLAVNDLVFRSSPVQVAGNWKRVVGAATNFAFLRNDNTLWSAGVNASGQVGDNTNINRSTPTQIATGGMWQDVVASHNGPAFMAKAQDNSIWVWGINNAYGILGVGDTLNRSAPTQIFSKDVNASFFAQSGWYFSLKINNLLYTWGQNNVGQLGMGNVVSRSAPIQLGIATDTQQKSITLLDNNNYTKVSAGAQHTVALRSNGTAWVFGQNTFGQLGQVSDTVSRSSPTQINAGQSYNTVFGLGSQTRLVSDSATFVAGNNAAGRGELGTGDTIARSSPVQLTSSDNMYVVPLRVGLSSWSQVSGGYSHTIAIRSDSTLWAWGYNLGGPLGQGTVVSRSSPVQIGTSSWASVSAGNSFNTAIRIDNTLWTWGLNTSGQLGDNTTASRSSPVQLAGLWIDSEAGNTFAGAISINNTVWTWGANGSGVLGNNSLVARSSPVQVGTDTYKVLSLTENSVTAIDSYSNLETWGDNLYGQIGNNGNYYSWSILSGAGNYFAAIRSDGTLWTWGENTYGQLGNNTTTSRSSPTQIGTSSWTNVRAGNSHVVAIRIDGTNWTWGLNTSGQVGDGTSINRSSPVQISTSFTDIAAGDAHTLAITSDGTLYAWGNNNSLQLGIYDAFSRSSPTQVPTSIKFKSLSAGTSHSLAIATDDTLYGWGSNLYGQVGKSTATFTVSGTATTLNAPGFITSEGKLYAWGTNNNGSIGDNTTISKSSPVQIGALTTWGKIIPTFSNNSIYGFFKTDDTLWVSGINSSGQLGQSDTIYRSSPVQLSAGAGRSWTSFVFGTSFGIGIKNDGSLWTVGDNAAGQLGDGTTVSKSSPIQIGTSSWSQVSAGNGVAGALKADGTIWTWGSGNLGGLAGGSTVYRSSMAQIGSGYASIYIADQGGHAITALGQLVVWGWNASGNLGDSTTVNKSGLTTIAGSWTQVACSGFYSRAGIRSDGTLWTWGENNNGQLGTGDTISRSSPVQISGGGSWTLVTNINSGSYAARKIDGTIWAWGSYPGDNTVNRSSPVQIYGAAMTPQVFNEPTQVSTSTWNVISAGALFSTAIRSDNKLFSWGNNNLGQLGVSNSFSKIVGTNSGGTTILMNNGTIWTSGPNNFGQLGINNIIDRSSPVQVGTFSSAYGINLYTNVASGHNGALAIKNDGTLWGWGYNVNGAVGDGTTINRSSPVQISTGNWQYIDTATDSSAANRTSYAIRDNGTLWTWGSNSSGQLGDGTSNNRSSPVQLGLDTWRFVTGSILTTVAIRSDYTLWTWGSNVSGKLGDGTTVAKNSPIQVPGSWSQVSLGSHVAALDTSGRLFTWGLGAAGQLGSGNTISRSSPVQVGTLSYVSVAAGISMTAAVDFSNRLYVWGAGTAGNLGDGTTVGKSSPIQIAADKQWLSVSIGADKVTAITTNNQIWMWGYNVYGAFGDNTTTYRSSPVQVSAFTPNYPLSSPTQVGTDNWSDVSAGGDFTAAIRTNGSLYAWGNNASGPLMDGTTNSRSSPVQVGGNLSYVHVSSGYSTLLVVNTNDPLQGNKLIASGAGTAGQLGDNTIVSKNLPTAVLFSIADNKSNPTQITSDDYTGYYQSSPVQVGSESWNLVSAGENHSLGIKSSGLLFAWGYNQNGQVGDSTTINKSSPVQISTATTWVEVEAGYNHNAVEKSDGSAYTFGNNNDGQLGDGT